MNVYTWSMEIDRPRMFVNRINIIPNLDEQLANHFNHDFSEFTSHYKQEDSIENRKFRETVQNTVDINDAIPNSPTISESTN